MQRAILGCLLCLACAAQVEPPACRDPNGYVFIVGSRVSSCGDWVEPDLDDCQQLIGEFDRDTCEVRASYACAGGVMASAFYVFRADEPPFGSEVFYRPEHACRVDVDMVEP
jgi:hypothetical protein